MLDVPMVRGPVTLGDEPVDRRADSLRARASEDLLRRLVEYHHLLVFVYRDDRVHRRMDDPAEARFAGTQRCDGTSRLAAAFADAHFELTDNPAQRVFRAAPASEISRYEYQGSGRG